VTDPFPGDRVEETVRFAVRFHFQCITMEAEYGTNLESMEAIMESALSRLVTRPSRQPSAFGEGARVQLTLLSHETA